jgi:hypothetical protein
MKTLWERRIEMGWLVVAMALTVVLVFLVLPVLDA